MSSTKSLNDNSTIPLINESEIMPEMLSKPLPEDS